MRSSEVVAWVYFLAMTAAGWIRPLPADRRTHITVLGLVSAAAIFAIGHHAPAAARDWAPNLYILAGYYISGRFFVAPSGRFERWLAGWDRRLLGDPTTRFRSWPRALLAYLEIVYVGCFLLVPAGLAALVTTGHAALADRYWTMVIAAEFLSFGPLALIQSRPPWMLERPAVLPHETVHGVASWMVRAFTIQANTFPSGHVAGSLAVACGVALALPGAAAVFFVFAASIAVACIVGRYHYIVDVVAGALLTAAIWAVVSFNAHG